MPSSKNELQPSKQDSYQFMGSEKNKLKSYNKSAVSVRRLSQPEISSHSLQKHKLTRDKEESSSSISNQSIDDYKKAELISISAHFKKKKKEKLAKTMYNTRVGTQRRGQSSLKKDYCPLILGKYRYGLNQKPPRSTDPNAPASHRFSQMACYRFAERNAPFMKLYDEQVQEMRKTRRFLSKEINKSPDGKPCAQQVHAESPILRNLNKKLKVQIIEEAAQEQIVTVESPKPNIQQLCERQKTKRLQSAAESYMASNKTSMHSSVTDNTQTRGHRVQKTDKFDKLLKQTSLSSLDSQSQAKLDLGTSYVMKDELDINADFVSDATPRATDKMQQAAFKLDQLCADQMFADEQYMMGLSLYYREQEFEQRRDFKDQQSELINYLNILFGKQKNSAAYTNMAKNLTKKLNRQITDDSIARKRQLDIQRENLVNLNIDEDNINYEIVGLLAEEVLQRTEFFDLLKGKQAEIRQIQEAQQERLNDKHGNMPTIFLLNDKTQLFNRVNQQMTGGHGLEETGSPKTAQSPLLKNQDKRLDSVVIDDHLFRKNQGNFLHEVVKQGNDETQNFEGEMKNVTDVRKQMAKASFITECEKNLVVTLPLLLRVRDQKIELERYHLNSGLCQALSISLQQFPDIATEFHLYENDMTDDDFAILVQGMQALSYISQLSYSYNSFGPKSLQALLPILSRKQVKHSLRSLHIKHCKISANVTLQLLRALNQQKNFLTNLSLVNANLNYSNYKELCIFVKSSRQLKELDVSWNGMRCHEVYEIIDTVSENRTLQDLNLSFNNMYDSMNSKYQDASAPERLKAIAKKTKFENKMKRAKTQAQKDAAERDAMDSSMQQILKLCKFIKMNSNLMHLNLSGMGMTQQMMHEFGKAMRRTKSMVSLHLSQNNGDTEELRQYLFERAHMKLFVPSFKPDFKQKLSQEYGTGPETSKFQLEDSIILGDKSNFGNNIGKSSINDQLNLKKMLKDKRVQSLKVREESDASEMLVMNRYLGHKPEMPGSGQWRMISTENDSQQRCWVCNLEVYSLIFWSRDFGMKTQQELWDRGIDEMAYENQLFELESRNHELGIEVDFYKNQGNPQLYQPSHELMGFPQIYGEFNNWNPQRMYTVEELCYIMDQSKPNILKNLQKGNFIRESVETVHDMTEKERELYDDHMKSLMTKYNRIKNWRKILGSTLQFKKPFLANSEALTLDNNINITKIDEELYPSDSESDFGGSNSDESEEQYLPQESDASSTQSELRKIQLDSVLNSTNRGSLKGVDTNAKFNKTKSILRKQPKANLKRMKQKVRMNKQLYVLPVFLQPGKQTFVVQSLMDPTNLNLFQQTKKSISQILASENDQTRQALMLNSTSAKDLSTQYFFHNINVPKRVEKVPLFVKRLARKANDDNKFNKNLTVFKDWKSPTEKDLQKMLQHDRENWKLPRFIKEEKELDAVFKVFSQNIRKLFYIYITMSASSNFPGITWLYFTKFAENCKVVDKNILQTDVDRFFLASAGDNAQSGCYRYQFFEAVMRLADAKYLKNGSAKTFSQALQMMLKDNCYPYGPVAEWQEFRDNIWWCYETHRVIDANKIGLNKIYKSYFEPRKKWITKADMIDMMSRQTKIIPDENKVIYCFGMSKMHIISETLQKPVYDQMKYVEFLEFLGRCAYSKYKDLDEEPMERKLEMLMDELLPTFGLVRKEVENEEEENSESDPDY